MNVALLLPARKYIERTRTAAHWLTRGDRIADITPGRESALRECFEIDETVLPIAALTRNIDANDAAGGLWLRADPAFVMADAVTLRLLACGNLGLSADEVEGLAQAVKPLFEESGFAFDTPHSRRWYLRCPRDVALPAFSSPDDALGDDLAIHLPEGENARQWRGLLNEAQIVLTQHPINAQRARRGLPPVNSVWFWGPGVLPQEVRCAFDRVVSDDEIVVALAKLALVRHSDRGCWNDGQGLSTLIDLADQRDMAKLDSEWFLPISDTLKLRQIAQLDLLFESGERYVVEPAHRWRFWRRTKTRS